MRAGLAALVIGLHLSVAGAQSPDAAVAPSPEAAVPLEEVLVTGQQPGPGLWKVTRPGAGNDHVLWILGSYGPLPKKMQWRSTELEAVLRESQEAVGPPTMKAEVGALGGVTLIPSLLGLRKNPDGKRLQDILPPDLHARWVPLKERYLGKDDDIEEWRPIFAAAKLYEAALRKRGFETTGVIWPTVEKLARKSKLEVTEPTVSVKVEKPRDAIKDFKRAPLDDRDCFAKTIERLESDLDLMRVRANAWAVGDVAKLRQLAPVDNASACIAVVMNAQVMQDRGYTDWPARRAEAWLAAVEQALARNASSVAVISVDQILKPDGYVAQLRARGYVIEEP